MCLATSMATSITICPISCCFAAAFEDFNGAVRCGNADRRAGAIDRHFGSAIVVVDGVRPSHEVLSKPRVITRVQ